MKTPRTPALATVQLLGHPHTVHATESKIFPYELRGPRGGLVETVRNVNDGAMYLMKGAKTLRARMTDIGGVFAIVD